MERQSFVRLLIELNQVEYSVEKNYYKPKCQHRATYTLAGFKSFNKFRDNLTRLEAAFWVEFELNSKTAQFDEFHRYLIDIETRIDQARFTRKPAKEMAMIAEKKSLEAIPKIFWQNSITKFFDAQDNMLGRIANKIYEMNSKNRKPENSPSETKPDLDKEQLAITKLEKEASIESRLFIEAREKELTVYPTNEGKISMLKKYVSSYENSLFGQETNLARFSERPLENKSTMHGFTVYTMHLQCLKWLNSQIESFATPQVKTQPKPGKPIEWNAQINTLATLFFDLSDKGYIDASKTAIAEWIAENFTKGGESINFSTIETYLRVDRPEKRVSGTKQIRVPDHRN
jgi:hypothetical protein